MFEEQNERQKLIEEEKEELKNEEARAWRPSEPDNDEDMIMDPSESVKPDQTNPFASMFKHIFAKFE